MAVGEVNLAGFVPLVVIDGVAFETGVGCAAGVAGALAEAGVDCVSPGIQWKYLTAPKAASNAAAANRAMGRGLTRRLPPTFIFDFAE